MRVLEAGYHLTLVGSLVTSCLTQHPFPQFSFWAAAHQGVSGHDGVVAIVVQRGRHRVQGAGAVHVAADPVVFAPLGDLLAVLEPVDL